MIMMTHHASKVVQRMEVATPPSTRPSSSRGRAGEILQRAERE